MPELNRAEVKRADAVVAARPLSPHLHIYRIQITSVSSILVRITGNAIIVGVILAVWWLFAAALSDGAFATANGFVTSWFGVLVFTLSLWGVWYHYLSGLRHLYFDSLRGLEIGTAQLLGWACIIGSLVLTVLTFVVI